MFMLKSTHEKTLAKIKADYEGAKAVKDKDIDDLRTERRSLRNEVSQVKSALDAERSISSSLRAEIEELRPLADKWKTKMARDLAYAHNKRKARK